MVPISLGVKAKVLTVAHQDPMTSAPVPLLPQMQPPWCSSNSPGSLLPQDICTGCSRYRNTLPQISSTWLPPSGLCSDVTSSEKLSLTTLTQLLLLTLYPLSSIFSRPSSSPDIICFIIRLLHWNRSSTRARIFL